MKSSSKDKATKNIELFDSLDTMIQGNWEKIGETKDLSWLIKKKKHRNKEVDIELLNETYLKLVDEYFELTKDDKTRDEVFVLMQMCIEARNEVMQGDKTQMLFVNKYEEELKELVNDKVFDSDKEMMRLSMFIKMPIDKWKITVKQYYNMAILAAEQSKPIPTNG